MTDKDFTITGNTLKWNNNLVVDAGPIPKTAIQWTIEVDDIQDDHEGKLAGKIVFVLNKLIVRDLAKRHSVYRLDFFRNAGYIRNVFRQLWFNGIDSLRKLWPITMILKIRIIDDIDEHCLCIEKLLPSRKWCLLMGARIGDIYRKGVTVVPRYIRGFIVQPGHTISKYDESSVYVTGRELINLYQLPFDRTIVSITEGEWVIEKHPMLFKMSQIAIINKIDLIERLGTNIDKMINDAKSINPSITVLTTSAKTGNNIDTLIEELGIE